MISYNIINNIVIRKKERIRDTDKVIWDPWRNCNYCRSGRGWGYSHTGKTIYLKDTDMERSQNSYDQYPGGNCYN